MFSSQYSYTTPLGQQMPSTTFGMRAVQQKMNGVTLQDGLETLPAATPKPWLSDGVKVARFHELKEMTLGSVRLLYGSDRYKFYDVVIGSDEDQATFCAALVCSKDGLTKILRTTSSDCPVKAAKVMVNQLQKDVMPLLVKFGAGTQLTGQQGYTNALTGKFELVEEKKISKPDGAADDTETLVGRGTDIYVPGAPKGPRFHRGGFKRLRGFGGEGRMPEQMEDGGMDGGLNYD